MSSKNVASSVGKSPAIFPRAADSLPFSLWNRLVSGSSSHWKKPVCLSFCLASSSTASSTLSRYCLMCSALSLAYLLSHWPWAHKKIILALSYSLISLSQHLNDAVVFISIPSAWLKNGSFHFQLPRASLAFTPLQILVDSLQHYIINSMFVISVHVSSCVIVVKLKKLINDDTSSKFKLVCHSELPYVHFLKDFQFEQPFNSLISEHCSDLFLNCLTPADDPKVYPLVYELKIHVLSEKIY